MKILSLDGAVILEVASFSGLDAPGAKLSFASLVEESIPYANLNRVDLSCADLSGSVFTGCRLNSANLVFVKAPYADFSHIEARESDWYSADLLGADFRKAKLQRASF